MPATPPARQSTGSEGARPIIWLLQDGEPLPIDDGPRLMRTGDLAYRLVDAGYEVVWWTSRFNHNLKKFRSIAGTWVQPIPGLRIALLDGPGYSRNMSFARMRHYRTISRHFDRLAAAERHPVLVLGSFPSPELCDAGRNYAVGHDIPLVVDIRDPWPDIFSDYFPKPLRWALLPLLWYYRRLSAPSMRRATGLVAVSEAMLEWGLGYADRQRTDWDQVFHIGFRRQSQEREIAVPESFSPETPLICLFATTCGVSYDGEMLVEAARMLESAGERRVRFVVTGDGDMRERWMSKATGLACVEFTGWVSAQELTRRFLGAHLGLVLMKGGITRFWLGNKIFEYLSASLGLVNDVPGEPEAMIGNQELGINVRPGSPQDLASALTRLLSNPAQVRAYMHNARSAFRHHYDRDVIQARYVAYLSDSVRAPRDRAGE